ncbi:unnamed protein product [Triticum turgidum subsp. durum]|uniref:Uncharacterized protein n=1 Tax=Triticum turgidum subsp. durum TaxID=4567 RepID=A0A9R0QV84_TRITD|nr:unnamed protein product [Triticum turgidum subsp. durum]
MSELERIVEDLGYEMAGRLDVYWCLPGLQIKTGGLRKMNSQEACDNISACVVFGHKEIQLFLDHDESYRSIEWDDVVVFPINDLPHVISPRKVKEEKFVERMPEQNMAEEQGDDNAEEAGQNMEEGQGDEQFNEEEIEQYMADAEEEDEADVEEEQEEDVVEEEHDEYAQSDVDDGSLSHAGRGVSDSENGDEIVDSDYAISDGDVDLLKDQIEEVVIDVKGKKAADIGACSDEEDLQMPDSDEDELKHNFNTFRPEDMHDPVFKVGQLFQSPEMLRKAIREYLNC